MKITSSEPVKLMVVTTKVAKTNEIHEMEMAGDVMKMRAHLNGLDIPANKPVELKLRQPPSNAKLSAMRNLLWKQIRPKKFNKKLSLTSKPTLTKLMKLF